MSQTKILKAQCLTYSVLSYLRRQTNTSGFCLTIPEHGQIRQRSDFRRWRREKTEEKVVIKSVLNDNDSFMLDSKQTKPEKEKVRPSKVKNILSHFLPEEVKEEEGEQLKFLDRLLHALKPSLYHDYYFTYSGTSHYTLPVDLYCEIKQPIATSKYFDHLCMKLNSPYSLSSGFSGATALLNLCDIIPQNESVYKAYKYSFAVDELFLVAEEEIDLFSTQELMKLILFRYYLRDFSSNFFKKTVDAFLQKLNSDHYSVKSVMTFTSLLKEISTSMFTSDDLTQFDNIIQKILTYIASRPDDIDVDMLEELYSYAAPDQPDVLLVLKKVLSDNLECLKQNLNIVAIVKEIYKDPDICSEDNLVNTLLDECLQSLTAEDLDVVLRRFSCRNYINPVLLKYLSEFIASEYKARTMSPSLVSSILNYCTADRHYDSMILSVACNHFIEDTVGYTTEQMGILLRAIGTFNFIPVKKELFFSKVELFLMKHFYSADIVSLLEMFVNLVYLDKIGVQFQKYIFSPRFLDQLNKMPLEDSKRGRCYLDVIYSAYSAKGIKPAYMIRCKPYPKKTADPYNIILQEFKRILGDLTHIKVTVTPTGSGYYLKIPYFTLPKGERRYVKIPRKEEFAFLILTDDSYCSNVDGQLLGYETANIKLLKQQGLAVYTIEVERLQEMRRMGKLFEFVNALLDYIQRKSAWKGP